MLIATLCLGIDLLTLTARPMPPDDGTEENYKPVIYRLTHTDTDSGETKYTEFDSEHEAVFALAAWAASDEPEAMLLSLEKLRSSELADTLA